MLVKKYILKSISVMFFPFFFTLFFISSIILILNIATLTSGIKLSFSDLIRLYYYGIPANTFFILALTFYSACVLGLSKLSYDSEMLVFFSLGFSPKDIIKFLLPLCTLVSFVLMTFSLVMMPNSNSAYRNFINYKKNEIDIDLKPKDFGQKIGDWLIYVDEKRGNNYEGLVLYADKTEKSSENFIIAQKGTIHNTNGILELTLYQGEAYFNDKDSMQNMRFDEMVVRNFIKDDVFNNETLYDYWKRAWHGDHKQLRRFAQSFCTSLFPLASIFLILVFGIKNPRFHKNYSYVYVLSSGGFYLVVMYILSMDFPLICLGLPFVWFFTGWYLYNKYIKRFY